MILKWIWLSNRGWLPRPSLSIWAQLHYRMVANAPDSVTVKVQGPLVIKCVQNSATLGCCREQISPDSWGEQLHMLWSNATASPWFNSHISGSWFFNPQSSPFPNFLGSTIGSEDFPAHVCGLLLLRKATMESAWQPCQMKSKKGSRMANLCSSS